MASQNSKISNKKPKLVRDSFTIPKAEFAAIDSLKTRAIALGTSVKKSELLRAGLMVLQSLNDAAYKAAVAAVPTLKTGRPATAPQAKPATKTPVKPAAKAPVKAAAKPGAKPVAKTAIKTAAKPVSKATTQPTAPKTAVAAPRPAAKRPAPSRRPAPAKKAA